MRVAILWVALGVCEPLLGATTAVIQVSAAIEPGCLIVGGSTQFGTLEFGRFPAVGAQTVSVQSTDAVQLQCTPGVVLNMTVGGGQYHNNGRHLQLEGGAAQIAYELFNDAALSQALETGQRFAVDFTNAAAIKVPVYGRANLRGNLPAGRYSDVVQVELSW